MRQASALPFGADTAVPFPISLSRCAREFSIFRLNYLPIDLERLKSRQFSHRLGGGDKSIYSKENSTGDGQRKIRCAFYLLYKINH